MPMTHNSPDAVFFHPVVGNIEQILIGKCIGFLAAAQESIIQLAAFNGTNISQEQSHRTSSSPAGLQDSTE